MYEEAIRVLLAGGDDVAVARLGRELDEAEGISVCAEVAGGEATLAATGAFSPDIVVMLADPSGDGPDCLDTASRLAEAGGGPSVILVTENPLRYLISAVKSGVAGILPAARAEEELVGLVRRVQLWSEAPVPV
jgi:DNA-binding NarL/FixJ family response regulator